MLIRAGYKLAKSTLFHFIKTGKPPEKNISQLVNETDLNKHSFEQESLADTINEYSTKLY